MIEKNKKIANDSSFLNKNIPFSQVLLVSENKKEVLSIQEALNRAKEAGLDLFCVAPQINPPVCKLINYQKHFFKLNKNKKPKKENSSKEMGFSFNIEENDLKTKLEKVQKWLESGSMVKLNLIMVGKEKAHPEVVREKCQQIIERLQNHSSKIELKGSIRQLPNKFWFFLYKKK